MSEAGSPGTAATAANAAVLALAHRDELIGGTRRDLLDRAAVLLSEIQTAGHGLPMAAAWRLGTAHHRRGEYPTALAYFEAALDDPDPDPVDRARFLAGHAAVLWAQGNSDAGRRVADEAMAAARACGDDHALGAAWVATGLVEAHAGDRTANLRAYEKALEHAERAGDAITVVRVRNNLGSRHVEAGRFRQALDELDLAVAVSEDHPVGLASAMVSINRAEALLGLGRLEETVGEIAIATEQFRSAEAEHMLAFALLLEADAHRVRGNATRAHAKYREAVERAETSGNAQVLGSAFAGLAQTVISDDPAAARAYAKRAVDQPHTVGDVIALRAAGWIALGQGDFDGAGMWADRALAEAGRRDQLYELADALELRALTRWSTTGDVHDALGRLAEAADAWQEVGSTIRSAVNRIVTARLSGDRGAEEAGRQALRAIGVRADADRIAGPLHVLGAAAAPEVAIRTFGTFAVSVAGAPVVTSEWPSRKSRQLVQVLAARRGRAMSRAALAELLWPGVRDTSGRLSVALSTARAVLDPGRRHDADRYLVSDRSHVRLDPTTVSVDVVEFERIARAALDAARTGSADAVPLLQAAASLHPAPFLADEGADDWADDTRDELLRLAVEVKRALAGRLVAGGETEQAVGWLMAVIADDPYDEPTHHELIRVLAHARRHGEARRAQRVYAARMAELEVEPTAYQAIVG
ncbi:BTAD domain-containing putative transcriptional regulator [Nocardioides bizhenqiangii]|uniref:BTAD domain-containing putative transcriptional regulator n=1 Tax=Nocardioides bizhenqiangii TaxID=3095076 RepID=A0ABZ0ZU83_9ACTN|nr:MULTISPECIES: BTAD domain-containing putative transcriptional regulator [unclassified Nocardioides]MDZ5623642.1 BTAD domain-containing putative transcriptional regulator [Nocardioides sp. HM23]WQQ27792.1 BTAD domain-containing putative transcriptional regulator [Nocardioides sp. HM61]